MGMGVHFQAPATLPLAGDPVSLVREARRPLERSGWVGKNQALTERGRGWFEPRTVQDVVSRYTD